MDVKEAIAAAEAYLKLVYSDSEISDVELEELERMPASGRWAITLSFARPRTSTQTALEQLGAVYPRRRTSKIVTMESDGTVLSMKDRVRVDAAE